MEISRRDIFKITYDQEIWYSISKQTKKENTLKFLSFWHPTKKNLLSLLKSAGPFNKCPQRLFDGMQATQPFPV